MSLQRNLMSFSFEVATVSASLASLFQSNTEMVIHAADTSASTSTNDFTFFILQNCLPLAQQIMYEEHLAYPCYYLTKVKQRFIKKKR